MDGTFSQEACLSSIKTVALLTVRNLFVTNTFSGSEDLTPPSTSTKIGNAMVTGMAPAHKTPC